MSTTWDCYSPLRPPPPPPQQSRSFNQIPIIARKPYHYSMAVQLRRRQPPVLRNPPTCTHISMSRVHTDDQYCHVCGRQSGLGWLYVCTQDSAQIASVEAFEAEQSTVACDDAIEQELHHLGVADSVISQYRAGVYTQQQIEKIMAQRQNAINTMLAPYRRGASETEGEDNAPHSVNAAAANRHCTHKCCHRCRPGSFERLCTSIAAVCHDQELPVTPREADLLRVLSSDTLANIDYKRPAPPRLIIPRPPSSDSNKPDQLHEATSFDYSSPTFSFSSVDALEAALMTPGTDFEMVIQEIDDGDTLPWPAPNAMSWSMDLPIREKPDTSESAQDPPSESSPDIPEANGQLDANEGAPSSSEHYHDAPTSSDRDTENEDSNNRLSLRPRQSFALDGRVTPVIPGAFIDRRESIVGINEVCRDGRKTPLVPGAFVGDD